MEKIGSWMTGSGAALIALHTFFPAVAPAFGLAGLVAGLAGLAVLRFGAPKP